MRIRELQQTQPDETPVQQLHMNGRKQQNSPLIGEPSADNVGPIPLSTHCQSGQLPAEPTQQWAGYQMTMQTDRPNTNEQPNFPNTTTHKPKTDLVGDMNPLATQQSQLLPSFQAYYFVQFPEEAEEHTPCMDNQHMVEFEHQLMSQFSKSLTLKRCREERIPPSIDYGTQELGNDDDPGKRRRIAQASTEGLQNQPTVCMAEEAGLIMPPPQP